MIKNAQTFLTKPLTNIFNYILETQSYPTCWALGYLALIHTTGNPLSTDNYRGITINSCLGKLFNIILNTRLENVLAENKLIHESQIAYKKNSRPSDHIFVLRALTDKFVKCRKEKLYACFVDFKKAFDSLNHKALFHKLTLSGISGKFLNILMDM